MLTVKTLTSGNFYYTGAESAIRTGNDGVIFTFSNGDSYDSGNASLSEWDSTHFTSGSASKDCLAWTKIASTGSLSNENEGQSVEAFCYNGN